MRVSQAWDTAPGLLSRIVRKVANQTSVSLCFHGAVEEELLFGREARFRGMTGQETGAVRFACSVRYGLRPESDSEQELRPDSGTHAPGRTVPYT